MSTTEKSVANADDEVKKGTKRAAEVRVKALELAVFSACVFFSISLVPVDENLLYFR